MLCSLRISNYALIDSIELRLDRGLNIITGETGGGKSIMLGALSLLLGGRADTRSIRHTDAKSGIEAEFAVTGNDALKAYCAANDIEWDDSSMILRREIAPSGRSRSFINDSPVTLEHLRAVGLRLVDIHSQHQNQLLSDASFQLQIIDTLADNASRLDAYSALYEEYRSALQRLKMTKAAVARDRENADFMQFQLQRIDELQLSPNEETELEQERESLGEAAEARAGFDSALSLLSTDSDNCMSLLSRVADTIADLGELIPAETNIATRLETARIELSDIADTLESLAVRYPDDAASRLDDIDERLATINSVLRRHSVSTVTELLEQAQKLRRRLERLDNSSAIISELERRARQAKKAAVEAAGEISGARNKAAAEFARVLHDTAVPLGMKNLVCDIAVEPNELSSTGMDRVEFRFAFNKNQTPVPVGIAASGGEISRLMLSIKSIIAHRMSLPSIIFDEVDTGVSGDVADRMGRMMRAIAANIQVIAITHLPQVAAKGSSHFKVFKHDTETSTVTHVEQLSPEGRVDEIALMLSGDTANPAARAAAEALLRACLD